MNFKEYQEKAAITAVYPRPIQFIDDPFGTVVYKDSTINALNIIPIMYCALGLTGEAGEVAEQVKKSWRNDMTITGTRRSNIKEELGDVLWYCAQLATELDLDLDDIADLNIKKLLVRKHNNELKHE